MNKLLFTIILLFAFISSVLAQTVTIYRGGVAISPVYSKVADAASAALNGDSMVLSAHTFYEKNLLLPTGTVWKGTQTLIDSSIIDAEGKSACASSIVKPGLKLNVTIRDIIFTRGEGGGVSSGLGVADTIKLKGYSIVRHCHSSKNGGAGLYAFLYDHAKLTNNSADSFGGAASVVWAFDSAEICYNTAPYGGGVGYEGAGGRFYCSSPGVRVHHNTATMGGGGIYGNGVMTAGQITDNQAPIGAAWWSHSCGTATIQNSYIYNPLPDGTRQNEVYVRSGYFNMEGSWFGKSDTIGLIYKNPLACDPPNAVKGRYAKANWSVNWGKTLSNKDTLFPIGAGFTYSDGTALPANSLPWLRSAFSSSAGKMLTTNPKISATDSMRSMYRTYVYATKGDTSSKPVNFMCVVDADTFRSSPRVWGIDSINLSIGNKSLSTIVRVYPNPTSEVLYLEGVETGSSIEMYDLEGKKLMGFASLLPDKQIVNISQIAKGNYILVVTDKIGYKCSFKILKE